MADSSKAPASTGASKLALLKSWGNQINTENKKKGTGLTVLSPGEIIPTLRLRTGAPSLDIRLGGGLPRGAITEIFGPEGSGKSTLAYQVVAEMLRRDPNTTAVLIDIEGSYSGKRGTAIGIPTDQFQLMHIDTVEKMFDALRDLLREQVEGQPLVDIVVIDSVAAMVTEAEDEGAAADFQVGVLARLMSKYMRQLSGIIAKSGQTLIFLNQTRQKIGIMMGNPETTPGGMALPFYAYSRIRTSRVKDIKDGETLLGQETKAIVKKAKLDDSVGGEAIFNVMRKDGVDTEFDIVRMGLILNVFTKNGNAISIETPSGETVKGAGRESFLAAVRASSQEARDYLYDEVVKAGVNRTSGDEPLATGEDDESGTEGIETELEPLV